MYFAAAKAFTKNAQQNCERRLKYGHVHAAHPPSGLPSGDCSPSAPPAARPWGDLSNTQAVRSDGWPRGIQSTIIHLRRNRELAFQLSRNRQLALCAACMKAI
tara:strand:- start:101 stop:409 length:309 start_codon:yes stop_codon:yes gene_type:complete